MSKKRINKRFKLTKELYDGLSKMCDKITPMIALNFRKKYSKRKTINTIEINAIFTRFIASVLIRKPF